MESSELLHRQRNDESSPHALACGAESIDRTLEVERGVALAATVSTNCDDTALARYLAGAAGSILLATRESAVFVGRALGETGDALSQLLLSRGLMLHRPSDTVVSEEAPSEPGRLEESRVWIIDPLDGTREYGEGRQDWAVHVALTVDGELTACAVALPGLGQVFSSDNRRPVLPRHDGPLRIAVSRTRAPGIAKVLAEQLGAQLMPSGSAGYKAMAVVRGGADAYVHAGGQYEWDSAAPVGVARAAGLHASRIDGSPLVYNQADPLLPDLIICRPELAERLLSVLAEIDKEENRCTL
jgi:3'(2'), 5'-bisphosphate nucleotidase